MRATYEKAVKIAYDGAYFVWLVNNQDLYGLSDAADRGPRGSTRSSSSRKCPSPAEAGDVRAGSGSTRHGALHRTTIAHKASWSSSA